MRGLRPLLAALLAGSGLAGAYSVDSAGGPLTLPEDVAAAFEAWLDAGAVQVPAEDGEGPEFRFAEADLLGPDAVSVTMQRSGSDSSGLEVVLNPETYRDNPAALLHETGIVLGLAAGTEGVMNPALGAEQQNAPTAADVELLNSVASAVPGDLDGDGLVGLGDLIELAAQLGRQGVNLSGDLNGDGEVNDDDLVVLRESYEFTEPREPAAQPEVAEDEAENGAGPESGTPEPAGAGEDAAEDAAEDASEGSPQPAEPTEPGQTEPSAD